MFSNVSLTNLWNLLTGESELSSWAGGSENGLLGLVGTSVDVCRMNDPPSLDPVLDPNLDPPRLPRNWIGSDTAPTKSSGDPIFTCRVNPLPNLLHYGSDTIALSNMY